MQDSSPLFKFETCNAFNSLECGEEMGDAAEEETGEHVGPETDETTEEAVEEETDETTEAEERAEAPVLSDVDEVVETEETAEERRTASPGVLRRGVEMLGSAFWTVVAGVGGAIGRIATAPFGRVKPVDKTCPVR